MPAEGSPALTPAELNELLTPLSGYPATRRAELMTTLDRAVLSALSIEEPVRWWAVLFRKLSRLARETDLPFSPSDIIKSQQRLVADGFIREHYSRIHEVNPADPFLSLTTAGVERLRQLGPLPTNTAGTVGPEYRSEMSPAELRPSPKFLAEIAIAAQAIAKIEAETSIPPGGTPSETLKIQRVVGLPLAVHKLELLLNPKSEPIDSPEGFTLVTSGWPHSVSHAVCLIHECHHKILRTLGMERICTAHDAGFAMLTGNNDPNFAARFRQKTVEIGISGELPPIDPSAVQYLLRGAALLASAVAEQQAMQPAGTPPNGDGGRGGDVSSTSLQAFTPLELRQMLGGVSKGTLAKYATLAGVPRRGRGRGQRYTPGEARQVLEYVAAKCDEQTIRTAARTSLEKLK